MLGYDESIRKAKDGVMVELINIGEGVQGDYNEENPDDVNLLRFYVYTSESMTSDIDAEDWYEVDSWCTNLPAELPDKQLQKGLRILFKEFYSALKDDHTVSIRRLGDTMSWISEENVS